MNDIITFNVEYTDTYGGEANYSWVRRKSFKAERSISDIALVRRAKKELGLSGLRCKTNKLGDMIELRPYRQATVIFITFEA